jgi:2-keto-4-pentenoate hydratase/2-oxohepta-3-ene-1,7-dioic acid hydratase in catechol pathway
MKYVSYRGPAGRSWGRLDGDQITNGVGVARSLRAALEINADLAGFDGDQVSLEDVTLLPPVIGPRRIFCVGKNYADHRDEMGGVGEVVGYPTIFTRTPQSLVGHGEDLDLASDNFDYEGELAVIIGTPGRHIERANAYDHIAGYSCLMDGTARDYQRHTGQFTPGKNFDRSGSCGPWLITPDDVGDPQSLSLETRVNGTVLQSSDTSLMLFDIATTIAYLSEFTELLVGDVIATGTPSGVGAARNPPIWLRPGDVVEVEVERVGTLRNVVGQTNGNQ